MDLTHGRKTGLNVPPGHDGARVINPDQWAKLLAGLAVVFAVFQLLAYALGSSRGEAGVLVAGVVIAALIAVECLLFRQPPARAIRNLGFGRLAGLGLLVAFGVSMLLLAVIPAYAYFRGAPVSVYPALGWLIPGLFAQAGIAEEALFRGYLFRHLRQGRPFWRAAALSTLPFAFIHLYLFWTLPWPVALASVMLATIISFPLAYLFELGGGTIWAPALLHFTVQGAIKILELPGDTTMPIVWMAASATIPWLAFAFGCRSEVIRAAQ
jgi:membrane protease YdiL (CAAX protease family)